MPAGWVAGLGDRARLPVQRARLKCRLGMVSIAAGYGAIIAPQCADVLMSAKRIRPAGASIP